jgi:hypothetical protein
MNQQQIQDVMKTVRTNSRNFENLMSDTNKTVQTLSDIVSLKKPAKTVTELITKQFKSTYKEKINDSVSQLNEGKITSIQHERNLKYQKLLLDTKTRMIKGFVDSVFNGIWKMVQKQVQENNVDPSKLLSASYYQSLARQWYEDNIYSNDIFQAYIGIQKTLSNVGSMKTSKAVEANVLQSSQENFRRAYQQLTGKDIELDNTNEDQNTQNKIDDYFGSMNKAYTDKQQLMKIAQQMTAGNVTGALLGFNQFLLHNNINSEYNCTGAYWGTYAALLLSEVFRDQLDSATQSVSQFSNNLNDMMMFLPNAFAYPMKILNMFNFEVVSQDDQERRRLQILLSEISQKLSDWADRDCAIYEMVAYFAEILLLMKTNDMLSFNVKDEEEQIRLLNMFGSKDALDVLENSLELAIESYVDMSLEDAGNLNIIYLFMLISYFPYIISSLSGESLDVLLGV